MKDRTFIGVASLAGGLLVLYMLSPPFVTWAFVRLGLSDAGPAFLQFFYAPLVMLYENFPPYKILMDEISKIVMP